MNFIAFLLLACCIQLSAHVKSQDITLNIRNVTLDKVFREIKKQTDYTFMYTETMLKETRKVSINVKNSTLQEVLDICFNQQPFTYMIVDKTVVVQPKETHKENTNNTIAKPPPVEIRGRVMNRQGEPLQNVSVLIKGTAIGTTTNSDGRFTISAPENKNVILEISSVGYHTLLVTIGKQIELTITLEMEVSGLSDIVVVGYGTQKKANLTGAVASISSDVLENKPLPNVGEVLRGVSPNLNIDLGAYGAEPGAKLSFNIRGVGSISGNSAPLILVDGVEMDINNLDPGTIESISVLKDASSSAIYGSRAPFGVILITTKKGKKNEGISIQYNNNMILGKSIGIPHMENSLIFATVYNQAATNAGSPPQYPDEQMQRIKGFIDGTYKTEYDPAKPTTSVFTGRRIGNGNWDWPHILFKDYKFDQR
ncbi:MAG: TonB-dependent receptor plug domain-containing protein, partial [Bacteroidetes bacterium]|nr:TonB-dependent receptor plug domain-containing protein [Bacteroidota bacterium]